jgi:hypothetical protein
VSEERPQPVTPALGGAVLDWVLGRVHRHIVRFGHRLTASDGRLDDLYVSLNETRGLLATGRGRSDRAGALDLELPAEPAEPAEPPPSPGLDNLTARFDLDPLSRRLLLLAAGPGIDRDLERLYTFAWADFTLKIPTAGFLAELATESRAEQSAALAALRDDAPLVRHRLVRLHTTEHWRADPPLLQRAVTVPEAVQAHLRGEAPFFDEMCLGAVRFERPAAQPGGRPLQLSAAAARRITVGWERAVADYQPVLLLVGPTSSGRRSALAGACAALGMPLLIFDPTSVPGTLLGEVLADLMRDARTQGAGLLVRGDAMLEAPETATALLAALQSARQRTPVPLAVTATRPAALGSALGDQLRG